MSLMQKKKKKGKIPHLVLYQITKTQQISEIQTA